MDDKKQTKFLKKAKRDVWWHRLLKGPISEEYHEALVRLECCSMSVLHSYIRYHHLSSSAEVLFFDLYAESHPELVSQYLYGKYVGRRLSCRIIESKNLDFVKLVDTYSFNSEAQMTLVKLNDAEYFRKVINLVSFTDYSRHAVEALIDLQNVDMLDCLLATGYKLNLDLQRQILKQNNVEMIDCYLKYSNFEQQCIRSIVIPQNRCEVMKKLIIQRPLSEYTQIELAKYGCTEMIEIYINRWQMHSLALIELVKRDLRNLLKLHFLKYGPDERAMVYSQSLTHFKIYIGI